MLAAANGKVVHVKWHHGYGWVVIIQHTLLPGDPEGPTIQTLYGHLRARDIVAAGKVVALGDTIGYMSSDPTENGGYTFTHLHFAVRKGAFTPSLCDPWTKWWPYAGYSTLFGQCNNRATIVTTSPTDHDWALVLPNHEAFVAEWLAPSPFIQTHQDAPVVSNKPPTAGFAMSVPFQIALALRGSGFFRPNPE